MDEMCSKEQQMEKDNKDNEPESPIDENTPTIKVCLRLPNGSKETITIVASNTVEVRLFILKHQYLYIKIIVSTITFVFFCRVLLRKWKKWAITHRNIRTLYRFQKRISANSQ